MSKEEMIKLLVDDFRESFAGATHYEQQLLRMKLQHLNESDLKLLLSQIKKEIPSEN
jgi:hypothetical protein